MKRRRYQGEYQRKLYARWREAVFAVLGNACVRCGFEDRRALQIDHVYGDAAEDRKRFCGGRYRIAYFKRIIEHPDRYQILCANCNWIKRAENGEQRRRAA